VIRYWLYWIASFRGSFELVVARMEKAVETLGEKIDKRLDRLSERMEKTGGS
jgi:hypothetical protein